MAILKWTPANVYHYRKFLDAEGRCAITRSTADRVPGAGLAIVESAYVRIVMRQ
jgi:hypothetical protein